MLTRFVINFKKKHPSREGRVLIDYNIVIVLLPMTLFGSKLGVFINSTFPDIVVLILRSIVLLGASIYLFVLNKKIAEKERLLKIAVEGD